MAKKPSRRRPGATPLDSWSAITAEIRRFRDERNWSQFHTPKDLAAAIAIEAGELQERFLWKTGPQIERDLGMADQPEPLGNAARGFQLEPVPLAIVDAQRMDGKALFARERRRDHRIEPARKQHHRDRRRGCGSSGSHGVALSRPQAKAIRAPQQEPVRRASAMNWNGNPPSMPWLSSWTSAGVSRRMLVRP